MQKSAPVSVDLSSAPLGPGNKMQWVILVASTRKQKPFQGMVRKGGRRAEACLRGAAYPVGHRSFQERFSGVGTKLIGHPCFAMRPHQLPSGLFVFPHWCLYFSFQLKSFLPRRRSKRENGNVFNFETLTKLQKSSLTGNLKKQIMNVVQ